MEYPIWQLGLTGGGFWVALISTIHVYVAQFAIGGGLYLTLTEMAARRENSPELLRHTRAHSKFFLLLTMVFGAVTGVGIWFVIALTSPQGTITLIHTFLFAWATEWTFFLGEIVALLVYFYGWDRLTPKQHLTIGWIYFLFGWLSLFMINGILGFMLTPGAWLQTHNFWDGFFNPTFWPQLIFRTFICTMAAGLFGFLTASLLEEGNVRTKQMRACSRWAILGLAGMLVAGWWYYHSLPPEQALLVMQKSARVNAFLNWFMALSPLLLVGGLVLGVRLPKKPAFLLSLVVLFLGLGLTGSFEFMREAARKPYLIFNHTYSNSILKKDVPRINEEGILTLAKWVPDTLRTITEENKIEAGQWLFLLQCSSCHSTGGIMNDILPRSANYTPHGMEAFLTGMATMHPYMPPFAGTEEERATLAEYLTTTLHNKSNPTSPVLQEHPMSIEQQEEESEYALLAWAKKGMHVVFDSRQWTLGTQGGTLRAQLVLRGEYPELAGEELEVSYALANSHATTEIKGVMIPTAEGTYEATTIPILPYRTDGSLDPYPVFTISATDKESGKVVASTQVALPTSTRMGCINCHGAQWKDEKNQTGMAERVAQNILIVHDRRSGTNLVSRAASGKTVNCTSCHTSKEQKEQKQILNLSASIHAFHAPYLSGKESDACTSCHPAAMQRDPHKEADIHCVNCHGTMENHTIALLKAEQEEGLKVTEQLHRISPREMDVEEIAPRKAWEQQPDCLTCHTEFGPPENDVAFNQWTESTADLFGERRDEMGTIQCTACHGTPHATYPAQENPVAAQLNNLQAIVHTGEAQPIGANGSCTACHAEEMEDPAHHPGMGLE